MTITHILVFILVALLSRILVKNNASTRIILIASLLFIYWMQPVSTIRSLEFWLPTIMIGLVVLVWGIISPREKYKEKDNLVTGGIIFAVILSISSLRYFNFSFLSGIINPPAIQAVAPFLLAAAALFWILLKNNNEKKISALFAIGLLLGLFFLLKYMPLTERLSYFLRKINGQSLTLADAREVIWVGYSYFAFRLIHVLREWQLGRPIDVGLMMFVIYVLFFPAFTAGPIDRLEHFKGEFENRDTSLLEDDLFAGGFRIFKGLFYKFILADSLALVVFNTDTIQQVNHTGWMWVMVYCFALRLYFDFSGYTDLAIGISALMGIKLPENFDRPYLSKNLTNFWNRWHITLTRWFRTYYFNPVTRYLRSQQKQISPALIILFTQITTMVLIGLWHGINLNFILWGLWNGLGLFIQNRWSEWRKTAKPNIITNSQQSKTGDVISVFLTFSYIALGWVWFAMPTISDSLTVFGKLLGVI